MSIDTVRNAFLWCAIINFAIVVVWFWLLVLARGWFYPLWRRWCGLALTAEQFDAANLAAMALYKVGILLLNLVPYIALRIVG